MNDFNKNDKQVYFNRVKGSVCELNESDKFCSITLSVGHENSRFANFVCKKSEFEKYKQFLNIEDKVTIQFYIVSRFKAGRWYTSATILDVLKEV